MKRDREEYPAEVVERLMPHTAARWDQLDAMTSDASLSDAQREAARFAWDAILTLAREVAHLEHERAAGLS